MYWRYSSAASLNPEGLSFIEWRQAAGITKDARDMSPDEYAAMTAAWKHGEDPTDYRTLEAQ